MIIKDMNRTSNFSFSLLSISFSALLILSACSKVSNIYIIEDYYEDFIVTGQAKIISSNEISIQISVEPIVGLFSYVSKGKEVEISLLDKDDFVVQKLELTNADFTASGYDSSNYTVEDYSWTGLFAIDENTLSLIDDISTVTARGFRLKKAAKPVGKKDYVLKPWHNINNWRALQKGMSPTSVKNLLGSPNHISSGNFPVYTYSDTVNYKSYKGTVTFYNGVVYSWNEPRF